ncbi:hypothetical protein BV898_16950 [Hypsibius exemplaris]|uniref:Uncharacterized protein n=1 Tax=Hypsibius exemplaris TaxID=2072580 RepID=A0A9X6NGA4_HYPEX|nr:hypothetical protein BV898_16950 [Hypsibius exemplaris]
MGNQQATRRVSFEREQTGLIAISDSVAQRLRNADGGGKSGAKMEQKSGDLLLPSLITTLPTQLEEQSRALTQLEEQWQERHKLLEGDNERIKLTSAEEFIKAVEHVETLFE